MYKDDHRFVILPLGGSALIAENRELELQEIRRITENIQVLIDSERDSKNAAIPEDRQAFQELCNRVGIRCKILNRRAIENYLSEDAIKKIKGDRYKSLGEYESLKDAPLGWGKNENWRIAREMRREDLEETDLGQFLKTL